MFLYTQHWMAPLTLLLVPLLAGRRWLVLSLVVAMVVVNVGVLLRVDELLVRVS